MAAKKPAKKVSPKPAAKRGRPPKAKQTPVQPPTPKPEPAPIKPEEPVQQVSESQTTHSESQAPNGFDRESLVGRLWKGIKIVALLTRGHTNEYSHVQLEDGTTCHVDHESPNLQ